MRNRRSRKLWIDFMLSRHDVPKETKPRERNAILSRQKPHVAINIQNACRYYSPGSPIKGTIELKSESDLSFGEVEVSLSGTSKSRVERSNGQAKSVLTEDVNLFRQAIVVHEGHYTYKAGSSSWPFQFRVPQHVTFEVSDAMRWETENSFASIQNPPTEQSRQVLPPSFRFAERRTASGWQASLEYAIEVKVSGSPKNGLFSPPNAATARKLIEVFTCDREEQSDMHDPRQRHGYMTNVTIQSLRLLPGHSSSPSSLIDRARIVFSPSSLPRFNFEVDVSYPAQVQNCHKSPLPFVIAVSPRTDSLSTTIQLLLETFYRYPSIRIRSFILNLDVTTLCRCTPALPESVSEKASKRILLVKRHFGEVEDKVKLAPRSTAWNQKRRRQHDVPVSIDLGDLCEIRLGNAVVGQRGDKNGKQARTQRRAETFFTPSFATPNIVREYYFNWTIEIECVGETKVLSGLSEQAIEILGCPPPELAMANGHDNPNLEDNSWIRPPSLGGEYGPDMSLVEHGSLEVDAPPRYQTTAEATCDSLSKI